MSGAFSGESRRQYALADRLGILAFGSCGNLWREAVLMHLGIGHLTGSLGYRGWRYIYVIEGVFSFLVGLVAVFTLQDTPQRTKWLTEEDKRFLELRAKFMYGGGGMGAKNAFSWGDVAKAVKVSDITHT